MRTLIRVFFAMAVVVTLAAGCAVRPGGDAPNSARPSSDGQVDDSPCPAPSGSTVSVTDTDSGRTICARVSQRVEVYLHGTVAAPWSSIAATGGPLRPTASGKMSLRVGVTGAVFDAVAPGSAEVVSNRPMCTSEPGGSGCTGPVAFHVTVLVRG
jgi:hypothetical protein